MLKIFKISIILILLINIFAVGVLTVRAESLLDKEKYSRGCIDSGDCQLNDFTLIAINISKIILSIVGSLALLAFVAGGLMMMLSAGNAEWVTRGRQTLIGAIIGLTIVFTSYTIIYFVFKSLDVPLPSSSNWFTSGWFKNK